MNTATVWSCCYCTLQDPDKRTRCLTLNHQQNTNNRYLRTGYLWDNVRVMGGAYGGFCNFNPNTGLFSFLSYRDPNLHKTLQIYDGCADYLTKLHLPAGTEQYSLLQEHSAVAYLCFQMLDTTV
jgi:Zn-dependent M16 (insulinase) family peptidase